MKLRIKHVATASFAAAFLIVLFFAGYVHSLTKPKTPRALTKDEQISLEAVLDSSFHERKNYVHPLPFASLPAQLDVSAGNAILIDTTTGSILYEKNADEEVPPASMTKLIVMYIAFQEIEAGKISMSDVVPLPPECWAKNLPSDSSIMFLDQGQTATLEDLLSGLAIASGNDAAIAIALYISGSVSSFVERMNQEVADLGLTHTHFVEPSGYSEENITTAKEFAALARVYLQKYPEALEKFHSQKQFIYPKIQNLPEWHKSNAVQLAVTQYNTNKLLGLLDGCDGLKTGFIYESGYNLSLTAQRNGVRFLSVTMHGKGIGANEGNNYRIKDGTTLMEWAFAHFADWHKDSTESKQYIVAVPGGKQKFVNLIPVTNDSSLTVPFITGETPHDAAMKVSVTAQLPSYIPDQTQAGAVYGKLVYTLGDVELQTIPLAADRTIKKAAFPMNIIGRAASLFL